MFDMKALTIVFSAALLATGTVAFGHGEDADLAPRVEGGKIIVDAYIDGTGLIGELDERVFSYEAGEAFPNFSSDPGYNARPTGSPTGYLGHGFPNGTRIGARFTGSLLFWDGAGAVDLDNALTQMATISFGPADITVDGSGVTSASDQILFLTSSGPASNPHDHLAVEFGGTNLAGIFVLEMLAISDNPAIADSEPVYLVYNSGELLEPAHEAAIEYVEENIVPEPGSLALLVLAVGAATVRRRRAAPR